MKKKGVLIYSLIISTIFILSLGFFAHNILLEYKTGEVRADNIYSSLTRRLSEVFDSPTMTSSEREKLITDSIIDITDYALLRIEKESSGEVNTPSVYYSYPKKLAKLPEKSRFIKGYSHSFGAFTVKASIYTLRPRMIFYYAKISFLIILFPTLLTITLIIYFSIIDTKSTATEEIIDDEIATSSAPSLKEASEESNETESETARIVNDPLNTATEEPKIENAESASAEDVSQEETEKVAEDSSVTVPNEKGEYTEASKFGSPTDPHETEELKAIYSEETGVSTRVMLSQRLDSELVKATSQEQDLSLFILKVEDMDANVELSKAVARYLLQKIQFRDRVFEYDNSSFSFIKLDTDIDSAESFAKSMLSELETLIAETSQTESSESSDSTSPTAKSESEPLSPYHPKCFIGISSRAKRMLNGERLLKEAAESLAKAETEDESHVASFHIDLARYREFISKTN